MKLFSPSYFQAFKCKLGNCTHSCCIGWEIDIDFHTLNKYRNTDFAYGKEVLKSIDFTEVPHFKLCKNDRCPHLNKQGLCNIIINLGEEYLCEICREHPRFYSFTQAGCEVGLGMACEEACRIILSTDFYGELTEIGEIDGNVDIGGFNPLPLRQNIFNLLSRDIPYDECFKLLCDELGVNPSFLDLEEMADVISSLEYLDPTHKELFLSRGSYDICDSQRLMRALSYFVYRHCATAECLSEFYQRLFFCLFCVALLRRVAATLGDIEFAARIISEELEYSESNTEMIKQLLEF